MLKHDPHYTRLGRPTRFVGQNSYWLGPDHLLMVRVGRLTERYQRFSYRDIQAVFLQRNKQQTFSVIISLVLLLISLLFMFAYGATGAGDMVGTIICASVVGAMGAILLVNLVKGPTCTCYLQTAVQTNKLPGLTRVRAARQAIDQLKTRVEQAQTPPTPVAPVA